MIKFKPLPGLTIAVLVCLVILLNLGTWQYKRLHWKRGLIAEIETAAHAPPITSLDELSRLINENSPVDFRRIALAGEFITPVGNKGQPFFVMRSTGTTLLWYPYRPFVQGQYSVMVQGKGSKDKPDSMEQFAAGPAQIAGYVRLVRKPNRFIPKSQPDNNEWFAFNAAPDVLDWRTFMASKPLMSVYIDAQDGEATNLPVKIPEIRNNHLDYMLTWYSFALILLIIYFILHKRQGRLYFSRRGE